MEYEIAVASIMLLAIVFLATVDMAFSQLSDVSLRRFTSDTIEDARVNTPFLREILSDRPRFRFALSATIQVLLIIFSVLVALIVYNFYQTRQELLIISLIIALFFSGIFRQLLPRFLTWRNPENTLLFLLRFVRPFYRLMSVFADPFEYFLRDKEKSKLETTIFPNQPTSDEEKEDNAEDKQALIEMGEAEGILEEKDRELLETMFEFSETKAGEIMTPRTEIIAVSIDATVKFVRDLIIEEKVSRLPVYRESIDNIEGVIYVRDLLSIWSEDSKMETIEQILRPAFFIPETKSAAEPLKNMQLNRVQIAIVVDEYGGVAGLVTVEDIVEEIVGEIEDEDEKEEIIEIIEGADKSFYDVLGSTEIGKIERIFGMEIEDDDFTTIAGLVTSEAGYVPKIGEKLTIRGLEVEILQAGEKRITLLRLRLPTDDLSEPPA
ncbi:MAG: hemolysin family protein [Pyrinomonadaceae bacterium]|nr:hemolysin family protein [Pyrinomonadaceae bacterium]